MRPLVCSLVFAGFWSVAVHCKALDVPSSIQETKAHGEVSKEPSPTDEEILFLKLLDTSVPPTKMDVYSLMSLQPAIKSSECEARCRLGRILQQYHRRLSDVQNIRDLVEYATIRFTFSQLKARADQEVNDWQKLSGFVAKAVFERKQSGDDGMPRRK